MGCAGLGEEEGGRYGLLQGCNAVDSFEMLVVVVAARDAVKMNYLFSQLFIHLISVFTISFSLSLSHKSPPARRSDARKVLVRLGRGAPKVIHFLTSLFFALFSSKMKDNLLSINSFQIRIRIRYSLLEYIYRFL